MSSDGPAPVKTKRTNKKKERLNGIIPLNRNLLVSPEVEEECTAGGVYIPETSRKIENYGKVIAVSQKVPEVKVGDTIMYLPYAGLTVTVRDRQYVALSAEDVIAVIENPNINKLPSATPK